jgi:hypothetical protein
VSVVSKKAEKGQEETIHNSMKTRGCRCPTAATESHSRLLCIQQSTNIICDRTKFVKTRKIYHS